ncbi:MAG: four helix bundle protein [Bacteroidia bacterium]
MRTKAFAVRCIYLFIYLFRKLPKTADTQLIGRQMFRSATSVAANYRAACIARSKAEFYAKLSIALEEADESLFWLEILTETEIVPEEKLKSLKQETKEIIFVLSKARKNTQK